MIDNFIRLEGLIGSNNLAKLKNSHIMLFGVGGVGSSALEVLARCGIENITIVDKDIVDVSNINRQLIALENTIGSAKVDVAKARIKNINHLINVNAIKEEVTKDNISTFFGNNLNLNSLYVIDAIDDVSAKVALITYCMNNNIKIISSTGTAKKLDLTKLKIIKMNQTSYDPLASKLRYLLRKNNVKLDFNVLCSTEQPQNIDNKILASYMPVVSTAGIMIADFVIKEIISKE